MRCGNDFYILSNEVLASLRHLKLLWFNSIRDTYDTEPKLLYFIPLLLALNFYMVT